MPLATAEILRRLGDGASIASICAANDWSREEFDQFWKQETIRRLPRLEGARSAAVQADVRIERDRYGIPHLFAQRAADLWFGFGYAMAQDRLFQLDYLRRKGLGRLAEVLGQEGVPFDLIARTVGLNRIAREELTRLPAETRSLLDSFAAGINAWIGECGENLPIEFALLDYRPAAWTPLDCLAIENEFRWYLTGRFPVIVMPELAKRVLGDRPLYREFLLGEADAEAILPPEAYAGLKRELGDDPWNLSARHCEEVGQATGDPSGTGSNNWVVAGRYTRSGAPMVASDPHIAFEAVSCWYEAHLCGGGFNVAGMAYVGMPAILVGRNERVAWGITNNICSQRDLYQEQMRASETAVSFLYDGKYELARELIERIEVKAAETITRTIRFSRNGPIVDEILPAPGNRTGPVSLKWLGAYQGGWLTALLAMNKAGNVAEFRKALRPWHVPTFNLVIADRDGHIAMQTTGRIPLRGLAERGYRPGWDPAHQWKGLLPFEAMPHAIDPPRGWLVTANNRLAANDYPYPLFGTWISGYRAWRIRQMIEAKLNGAEAGNEATFDRDDFRDMHQDTVSLRAVVCLPPLCAALANVDDSQVQEAVSCLRDWDGRVNAELVAPTLFNLFYINWSKAVALARFEPEAAELLCKQAECIASRLLADDPHGWFASGMRVLTIERVFRETLAELTQRLGPQLADWTWGRLHKLPLVHVLGRRGDLAQLLEHGGEPVNGDMTTVCNTGAAADWLANSGAGYRMIVDLSEPSLWAVDAQSQSGNPGSENYGDQFGEWNRGDYHLIPLFPNATTSVGARRLVLHPRR